MRLNILATIMSATLCYMAWGTGAVPAQEGAKEVGTDIGTMYRDQVAPLYKRPGYSPYAGRNYPTRVFGATRISTPPTRSMPPPSATRSDPRRPIGLPAARRSSPPPGSRSKLSRPLDFLVVADHAEGLGSTVELKKGNPLLMADPTLKRWHDMMAAGQGRGQAAIEIIRSVGTGTTPKAHVQSRNSRGPSGRTTRRRPSATTSRAGSPP